MQRVSLALLVVAAAFAAMVFELGLGRNPQRAALFVFVGVLVVGYPLLFLCCKRGWWKIWQTCFLGMIGGMICTLPFTNGPFGIQFLLLVFVIAGAALGMLFWLIAIWRNVDLTCPKSFCLPCGMAYRVARKAMLRRDQFQSK
ncbi:MAG: hypothetical protein Q8M20_14275 [Rhodocyclaceae bacterium]|nr:hypothetical protein [Rhodocyclaceae bacterium]MDZ4216168.1 hypothetical protein [Rhodocyclaceae bacterium]